MRVLVTSTSGRGHFQPLRPLVSAFVARGDQVLVVVPRSLYETLTEEGFALRAGDDPAPDDAARVWDVFPTLERRAASRLVEREWFGRLCREALAPVVDDVVDSWSPELVLRETCEYAALVAADRAGIHHAQVGISTAAAEASVWAQHASPDLEALSPGITERCVTAPYLTMFPETLDPSPYPDTRRFRGPDAHSKEPLPDWWFGDRRPLVYLTLGTVATSNASGLETLRWAMHALKSLDVRLLVSTGPKLVPDELGPTPANVRVEGWVDQVGVLSEAAAVVCHGGSGTVMGALGAGVPLVILPLFADQPTNARLVADAGAALVVADGEKSAIENVASMERRTTELREQLVRVLHEPSFRIGARRLAAEILNADAPEAVARRLADDVAAYEV